MVHAKRTVLAVDDEQQALDYLIRRIKAREDLSLVLATTDGELAKSYVEQYTVDIVIVDLDLRTIEGYDIMRVLDKHTQIIVCTASATEGSYAIDEGAVEFLSKPFGTERFNRAVDRAIGQLQLLEQRPPTKREEIVVLPNADRSAIYRIRWDEIVYIRSYGKVTMVFRNDGRVFRCGYMLRKMEEMMPASFLRIHRSFLLNINEIEYYSHRLPRRQVYVKRAYQTYWRDEKDPETKGELNGALPVGDTYHERLAAELER